MGFFDFFKPKQRSYAAARSTRLTSDWIATNTSADSEIKASLRLLRARSRQVVRDNAYARNAQRVIVNNVVGGGIGLQAQVMSSRGILNERINDQIESAWEEWSRPDSCHTGGVLGLSDILRVAMSEVVESGEVLIRRVRQPFGESRVPYALEVIEADQLADEYNAAQTQNGNTIRMGVEVDRWNRPVAYWIYPNHPGDIAFRQVNPSNLIRVPADEVFHLYICERWPQTRGVPMMHAALERMNDLNAYTRAEIVAARASANVVGFIKSPEALGGSGDFEEGERIIDSEPGTFRTLLPGEDFVGFNPSRPNAALDPFCCLLVREMAAAIGVSYESLSKDYSKSNYSSSRLSLLEDRDGWRVLQKWFIRNLLDPVFREWLDCAVLAGVVKIGDYETHKDKYQRIRWKPRGWSWIDPTKEVDAYIKAVNAGFMTMTDVIAQTGSGVDAEDVFKARAAELSLLESLGLKPSDVGLMNEGTQEPAQDESKAAEPSEQEPPDEETDESASTQSA